MLLAPRAGFAEPLPIVGESLDHLSHHDNGSEAGDLPDPAGAQVLEELIAGDALPFRRLEVHDAVAHQTGGRCVDHIREPAIALVRKPTELVSTRP
jgi:hypothetical protein